MSEQGHVFRQLSTVLDQGRRLLEGLPAELYDRSPEPIATSTIGAHVRHVLDCAACLVDGLAERRVDYDRRQRDLSIEREPEAAARRLGELADRLVEPGLVASGLAERDALEVRAELPAGAPDAACWTPSSVGRELVHVLSHTVHHYALIATLMRHFDVEPEEGFGVAPSTLLYWEESGRCAPLAG